MATYGYMATVNDHGLWLWPRLYACPICDYSTTEAAYVAMNLTISLYINNLAVN